VIRAVLDTNVFVSSVIAPRGAPRRALEAWLAGRFTLVISEAIIGEVTRVLRYPRIRDRYSLTEDDVAAVADVLLSDAEVVAGLYEVRKSADLADDMFLARALEGRAEYVVSGDSHLLEIGSCHGVLIVTPRQFMKLLAVAERQGEGRE
jgi:putative PIN family toxin of toxin-antitoxin system